MKRNKKENHLANKRLKSKDEEKIVQKHRPEKLDDIILDENHLKKEINKVLDEVQEKIKISTNEEKDQSKEKSKKSSKKKNKKAKKKQNWIAKILITIALIVISLIIVQITISTDNAFESNIDYI